MLDAAYRRRLDSDIARWQSDGVITAAVAESIRARLGPVPQGVNIPTVIAILGALLIAAAFLTFVAANWHGIARPARFLILLAGIAAAYALAAWSDRRGRVYIADVCATVGSIVFGAAIALTGQMYHLGGDFSAGVLLWAIGAMIAALLTGSRGALAVALAVGCFWNGMRVFDADDVPNFAFVLFWLVGAALAVAWNSGPARHLAALAALAWWTVASMSFVRLFNWEPLIIGAAGAAFMFGLGLALAAAGPQASRDLGRTLASYAALTFVVIIAFTILGILEPLRAKLPDWVAVAAVLGLVLAFAAAAATRSIGTALAGLALAVGLALAAGYLGPLKPASEPWLGYALALVAMLSMVISGMLDEVRPRVVAGWLGLGTAIAVITWSVEGGLLKRALFLAIAGAVAVALAVLLGRYKPKGATA